MKKLYKIFFTMLSLLFIGNLGVHKVTAAELKSTGIIDSIAFHDSALSQGQLTSINVHFSKKADMTIAPGDTITLELPPELQGLTEKNGAPRRIALSNLGEALVYQEKIVVTFNENVRHLDQIKGDFTFGVRTAITNSTEDTQIATNLGTATTTQTLVIKGQSQIPDTEERSYPFFYKSGDLLGDDGQVRWFLNVNLNKEAVASDIEITDQLGTGQVMNPESFYITVTTKTDSRSINATEFVRQGYGTIELLSDTAFALHLFKEKANLTSFTVMYTTTITPTGQKQATFDNHYKLKYQLSNAETTLENDSAQVKNIFADGNADGTIKPQMPQEPEVENFDETTEPLNIQHPESVTPDYVEVPNELNDKPTVSMPETQVDDTILSENDETTEPLNIQHPENVTPDYVEVPNELNDKPTVSIPETRMETAKKLEIKTESETLKVTSVIPSIVNQQTPFTQQVTTPHSKQQILSASSLPKTGLNKTNVWLMIGLLLSTLAFLGFSYQVKSKRER